MQGRWSLIPEDNKLKTLLATIVHERVHLSPEQIEKDERIPFWDTKRKYFRREVAPFSAEFKAREEYRQKHNLENNEWKVLYQKKYKRKKYNELFK